MNKNTFKYRMTETRSVYSLCRMSPTEIAKETEKNFWLLVSATILQLEFSKFHVKRFAFRSSTTFDCLKNWKSQEFRR